MFWKKKVNNRERAKEISLDFDQDMTSRLIAQAYEHAVWEDNVINGTSNTDEYYFKKAIKSYFPFDPDSRLDDFVKNITTIDELIKKVKVEKEGE